MIQLFWEKDLKREKQEKYAQEETLTCGPFSSWNSVAGISPGFGINGRRGPKSSNVSC